MKEWEPPVGIEICKETDEGAKQYHVDKGDPDLGWYWGREIKEEEKKCQ